VHGCGHGQQSSRVVAGCVAHRTCRPQRLWVMVAMAFVPELHTSQVRVWVRLARRGWALGMAWWCDRHHQLLRSLLAVRQKPTRTNDQRGSVQHAATRFVRVSQPCCGLERRDRRPCLAIKPPPILSRFQKVLRGEGRRHGVSLQVCVRACVRECISCCGSTCVGGRVRDRCVAAVLWCMLSLSAIRCGQ